MHNSQLSKPTTLLIIFVIVLAAVGLAVAGLPAPETAQAAAGPGGPVLEALPPPGHVLLQATVGYTFTYQGRLEQETGPVDGSCDLTFKLFDSPSGGSQVGSDVSNSSVVVQDGYFTQPLNFGGGMFDGSARWLEITINSCNGGSGSGGPLSPRVALSAAPYALYALDGPWGGSGWNLSGNSGTSPGTHFLGTTDVTSLTLAVNNMPGLRLAPGGGSGNNVPNVIGGSSSNVISDSQIGSVIGGGGNSSQPNRITANYATIGGGRGNLAAIHHATVSGGRSNQATEQYATVGGGYSNEARGSSATVGGGDSNIASNHRATVGGGYSNEATDDSATVGGGYSNVASGDIATVSGGIGNEASGYRATVGGGDSNVARSSRATVGGGYSNVASGGDGATVGGGIGNEATARNATVPGGYLAQASHWGEMAYAAGRFAATGDAQTSVYVLRRTTTGAEQLQLFLDGDGGSERITLPVSRTMTFDILITAAADNGDAAAYQYAGGIKRTSSGISLVGSIATVLEMEDDAAWNISVSAYQGGLRIRATGVADRTIHWVATVRTAETVMP